MKFKKLLAVGATLAVSAFTLAACGSKSGDSGKTLHWEDSAEISTLDPSKVTDVVGFNQLNNVTEGLYRLGKDSKITPGLATKTTVSKDGLTYTFTLRKDAKWSNGDKVTAKDFVYSWQRTVNPKTGSQYAYLFSGIKNADAIMEGKKSVSELGVKADGDYKLVVTLDKKIPYFKLLMGFPLFFPQNQKVVEKYGSKYGTASKYFVYDGPFKQEGWTGSNLSWKLVKNDDYWDKKAVKLDKITYQVVKDTNTGYNLFQSGKLDGTLLSAEQTKQLKGQKNHTVFHESTTFYLQYNQTKEEFKNANIRKAISLAINRKDYLKVLGGENTAATSVTPVGLTKVNGKDFQSIVSDKTDMTYNKAKAKELFNKGLQELGKDKLEFAILTDDTDTAKKSVEALQSQLKEAFGDKVTVNTQTVPFKTRLSRSTNGDFDVVLSAWGADFADPISFLDLFTSNNEQNNGKWSNAEYDKLIAASKNANSASDRWSDLEKAEKILLQDQGVTPLYYRNQAWMVNDKVKGIIYNTAGANLNFKDTYIAK